MCRFCNCLLESNTEILVEHSKICEFVTRLHTDYNYTCLFCEYHTYDRSRMRLHVRTHIGDKPFKCTICDHTSSQKGPLKIHMRLKHALNS